MFFYDSNSKFLPNATMSLNNYTIDLSDQMPQMKFFQATAQDADFASSLGLKKIQKPEVSDWNEIQKKIVNNGSDYKRPCTEGGVNNNSIKIKRDKTVAETTLFKGLPETPLSNQAEVVNFPLSVSYNLDFENDVESSKLKKNKQLLIPDSLAQNDCVITDKEYSKLFSTSSYGGHVLSNGGGQRFFF